MSPRKKEGESGDPGIGFGNVRSSRGCFFRWGCDTGGERGLGNASGVDNDLDLHRAVWEEVEDGRGCALWKQDRKGQTMLCWTDRKTSFRAEEQECEGCKPHRKAGRAGSQGRRDLLSSEAYALPNANDRRKALGEKGELTVVNKTTVVLGAGLGAIAHSPELDRGVAGGAA